MAPKRSRKTRKQTKRNRRTRRRSQKGGAIQRVIIKATFELLDRTNNSANNNNRNNRSNNNNNINNNNNSTNDPSNTPNNNSNHNNATWTNNPQNLNTGNPTPYSNSANSNTEEDDIIDWFEEHGFEMIGMYGGTNPMIEHSENDTYIISYTPDPSATKRQIYDQADLIIDLDEDGNYPIEKDGRTYLVYGEIASVQFE